MKKIFTLITLCIINFSTYAMELELTPLLAIKKSDNFHLLKLPEDCLDLIIFSAQPQEIGMLKNTCKQLSLQASIMRINEKTAQHFKLDNDEAIRSNFFKRITQLDNSEYITTILNYGKRQAHLQTIIPTNATTIIMDPSQVENDYLNHHYLPLLEQHAIEQNTFNSVFMLFSNKATKNNNQIRTELVHAVNCDSDNAIRALLRLNCLTQANINDALSLAETKNKDKAIHALSKKKTSLCKTISCYAASSICFIGIVCGIVTIIFTSNCSAPYSCLE